MEREMPLDAPGWWSGTGGLPNLSSSVQHGGFMIITAHLCGRLITQVSSIVNEKNYHYPFLPRARALGLDVPSYKLATFIIHCSWMTHALGTRLQPESGELDFCGHLLSLIPTGVNPSESMEAAVAGISDGCRNYAGEQLPRLLVHFQEAAWVDRKLRYELTLLPSGFRGRYAGEGTANIKPLEISWSRVSRRLAYSF